ncbi:E3 ubiquitin-protein ligase MARCHF5-like [Mytilus trossulus]|uniref:E3 ubiquitin-protein ligase MARCHF5-like n=1 Tax=Mytilus trossulus TaxID=6551 RepID=UPI003005546A
MSSVAKLYHRLSEEDRRSCWVCFATDEDDMEAGWVQPCMCKGTTKWVHQYCLQRWIDEKQKGNSTAKVACPQCNMEYIIIFPKVGPVVYILEKCDKIANMICPFLAGSVIVGSLWWTAVTYGAITVMQVLGSEEGVHVMQVADPLFLLITLPTIPIMMILCKMVRWEDYVLRLWRKHSAKLPFYTNLFPDAFRNSRIPAETAPLSDPISILRVMCGALIMPTIATIAGKVMFGTVRSNFQRTLLGGIGFIAIKGVLKIYYKQQQYLRQANRVIMDYKPPDRIPSPP